MESEALRDRLCALVDVPAAGAVLDAGCGDGADLRRLGSRLGPDARLVGVDSTVSALAKARAATGGDGRLTFCAADLSRPWPLGDAAFDGVFSLNTLECLPDKQGFLAEAGRVLRPGGQVVCAHWDWDTQTVDGADKALVRRVTQAFSDWQQDWMADADGWMGRRLWRTFQASGLFAGCVEALTLTETEFAPGRHGHDQIRAFGALARRGMITPEDHARLQDDVAALAARGEYFYSLTLYVYIGNKR